jgi:hypothetical protein
MVQIPLHFPHLSGTPLGSLPVRRSGRGRAARPGASSVELLLRATARASITLRRRLFSGAGPRGARARAKSAATFPPLN